MRLVRIYSIKLNNGNMSLSCILTELIHKSPFDKTDIVFTKSPGGSTINDCYLHNSPPPSRLLNALWLHNLILCSWSFFSTQLYSLQSSLCPCHLTTQSSLSICHCSRQWKHHRQKRIAINIYDLTIWSMFERLGWV